ncbi:MAG: hypothetical protein EBV79_05875 [Betaproteobacteria bacterium]|nr:hypothetical protein [Betaproteobacteria bacterium]
MKLATYKDGSRDGQLVVVSRDLTTAHYASGIAHRLQQVLDDWNFLSPQLQDLYETLNHGKARHAFPFEPQRCMAPLPRAYQWADGSAYINHVELVRAASATQVPDSYYTEPLMYQGGSDDFIGPTDPIVCRSEDWGIDFEAEMAVITGDVPMAATPEQALDGIRLVMLANDVSLRNLVSDELAKYFGFLQSGYSCIAEKRTIETLLDGAPSTGYMRYGDTVRIEMKGLDGQSVFGAIEQAVTPLA